MKNGKRKILCLQFWGILAYAVFNFLFLTFNVQLTYAADGVLERYQTILQNDPKTGAVFDRVFNAYLDTGETDVFLNHCKNRVEREPDDAKAQQLYGLTARRKNDYKTAISAFQRAVKLDRENYLAALYLGEVLVADGQYQDGIAALEDAVKRLKATDATGNQLRNVLQTLGKTLMQFGEKEKAEKIWNELEELFPDDDEILIQITEILTSEGKIDEAIKRYEKLIVRTKDDYERVRRTLAVIDLKASQNKNILDDLTQLLDKIDSENYLADTIRERIENLFQHKENTKGLIAFYKHYLGEHPNDTATLRRLAAFLEPVEAEILLTKAIEKSPHNIALRSAHIDILTEQKRFADAVKEYEAVNELEPDNTDYLTRWGLLLLQDTGLNETQRKQEALKIWQRISDTMPDDPVSATAVADLCFRNGLESEAETFYRRAFELQPDDFAYREHLAKYYNTIKNKARVLEVLLPEVNTETFDENQTLPIARLLLTFGYAAECCHFLTDKINDDWDLQRLYIEALIKKGSGTEALKLFAETEKNAESDKQFAELLKQEVELLKGFHREDTENTGKNYRGFWKQAAIYQSEGKLQAAVSAVEHALNLNQPPELLQYAAELYEQTGNIVQAMTLYKQLAAKHPAMRNDALRRLATLQIHNGELNQALETGKGLLGAGTAANSRYYAELLISLGQPNEAVNVLRQGLRREPGNTELLQLLADTLNELNQKDEAFEITYRQFEATKDLSGKLSILDALLDRFGKAPEFLQRLKVSKQKDTPFCIARVLAKTGEWEESRTMLENLLRPPATVPPVFILTDLVFLCEKQNDIPAAVKYQEILCRTKNDVTEQEHLFRLYDQLGDTEKSEKLFLDLVLRQGSLENKLEAIDTMIRREKYDTVLKTLDFLDIHESENWQIPLRRIVIGALKGEPAGAAVREFRELVVGSGYLSAEQTRNTNRNGKNSANNKQQTTIDYQGKNVLPPDFIDSLSRLQPVFEKIVGSREKATVLLNETETFDDARFAVLALELAEAVRKDFGKNNSAPAIWHNFKNTLESIRDSLPTESSKTSTLLDRLRLEMILQHIYSGGVQSQIVWQQSVQNTTLLIRRLGLFNVPNFDVALFQILIDESVYERIVDRFKDVSDDRTLELRLMQILTDYFDKNGLPALNAGQLAPFLKQAIYQVKSARTLVRLVNQDEPLTQEKRNELLNTIWTKFGNAADKRSIALFETAIAPRLTTLNFLQEGQRREREIVRAARRSPNWLLFMANDLTLPVNDDLLLFYSLRDYEPLTAHWQRMMPMIVKALKYEEEWKDVDNKNHSQLYEVLSLLLYALYLKRYDIFLDNERELAGGQLETILTQLQEKSDKGTFARQLFGYEPYPPNYSQRVISAEQIKRIAELDEGITLLLDFVLNETHSWETVFSAGHIDGLIDKTRETSQAGVTESRPPGFALSKYQSQLSGEHPVERMAIQYLVRSNPQFLEVYSPAEKFFLRIGLLYRALDMKTRYLTAKTDTGTALVRHDYLETYKKRLQRLRFSTVSAERKLAAQLNTALNVIFTEYGIDNRQSFGRNYIETLTDKLEQHNRNASETLALALCYAKSDRFSSVLPLLDSLDLKTPQDKQAKEMVAVRLVQKLGKKATEEQIRRGRLAVERLMNYRLTDREAFDLLPMMKEFGMENDLQKTLDRLVTTVQDRKLQADLLTRLKQFSNQRANTVKVACRILENPAFMQNARHITADTYLLDSAIDTLKNDSESIQRITQILENRFRSNPNKTDGKLMLAKLYKALDRTADAKQLVIELAQDPPTEPDKRQMITSLLLHFELQKELDAMNRILTQKYNRGK